MKMAQFWDGTHPLYALQEQLHAELVPPQGKANTPHGELLRCATNLYYDVYNNGFCNARVLEPQVDAVAAMRDELIPYLEDRDAFKRFRSALREACQGDEEGDADGHGARLEDILTAVVKYVAVKAGKTLPAAAA